MNSFMEWSPFAGMLHLIQFIGARNCSDSNRRRFHKTLIHEHLVRNDLAEDGLLFIEKKNKEKGV